MDRIRQFVVEQGLEPGDVLPPVTRLAKTYKVSTTSVREALKQLEGLGLVRGVQRKGFVLVEPSAVSLLEWVTFSSDADRQHYMDLLIARSVLEPAIMPLIVREAWPEDIDRLESIVRNMAEVLDDWDAYNQQEARFHLGLFRATRNPALEVIGRMLCECFAIPHSSRDGTTATEESYREHRAIVEALRAGDVSGVGDAARRLTRKGGDEEEG